MTDTEDIVVALRNAIERGQSINLAKQSLINSGYPEAAVNTAADSLANIEVQIPVTIQKVDNTIKKLPEFGLPLPPPSKEKKKGTNIKKFIILIIIVLLLGGAAAYLINYKPDLLIKLKQIFKK